MTITEVTENDVEIALVNSSEILITDIQSAVDLLAMVLFETHCSRMILNKEAICEDFFDLKTRLAGDVLQKFMNYQMKLAVVGDFSAYKSKSLKDFIYESNKGNSIFFLDNEKQALDKLSR
jgi:hypothetical protein